MNATRVVTPVIPASPNDLQWILHKWKRGAMFSKGTKRSKGKRFNRHERRVDDEGEMHGHRHLAFEPAKGIATSDGRRAKQIAPAREAAEMIAAGHPLKGEQQPGFTHLAQGFPWHFWFGQDHKRWIQCDINAKPGKGKQLSILDGQREREFIAEQNLLTADGSMNVQVPQCVPKPEAVVLWQRFLSCAGNIICIHCSTKKFPLMVSSALYLLKLLYGYGSLKNGA